MGTVGAMGGTRGTSGTGGAADPHQPAGARLCGEALVATLTAPRSVVVVGASPDPDSYASKPLEFLRRYGYAGRMLAVNPRYGDIAGVPCLPTVAALEPGTVDVAMVTLPADKVAQSLRELDAAGVRAAITIAGGFDGGGGAARAALRAAVAGLALRVIGPNCIGVVNPRANTYLTFSREIGRGRPRAGSIALVTQSGAVGNALLIGLLRRGAGLAHWITSGDEVDTGTLELVAGLLHDPAVRGVGVFFEGMTDLAWLPAVRAAIAATGKPVYVLKGATTDAGRAAAAGHTGRVVGAADAARAVMQAAGMTLVPSAAHLTDALVALDVLRGRPGGRVGVLSVSGGFGVMAGDAVRQSAHLSMAPVVADARLPRLVGGRVHAVANPLDVAGSKPAVFADWIKGFASSATCDLTVAVNATMLNPDAELADAMLARAADEPVVLVPFTDVEAIQGELAERLAAQRIAVMPTVERAIAALDGLPLIGGDDGAGATAAAQADEHADTHADNHADNHADAGVLGLEAAVACLPELPWAPFACAGSLVAAREQAARLGTPLVVKVAGRTLQHRSEAGGVRLGVGLAGLDAAWTAIAAVAAAHGDAVLLQRQAAGGLEVLVAVLRDPELGPLALVRPGGIFTELLSGDVVLWSGWSADERAAALANSVVGRLAQRYRGGPAYDLAALADLIERLLAACVARNFAFIELNPMLVGEHSVTLVDALLRPAGAGTD